MHWHATIQDFLTALQSEPTTSVNTVMAYRNDLNQLADHLNSTLAPETDWSRLTQNHLNEYVASMAGKYAASTIARKIAAIKTLFHWLHKTGLTPDDPSMRLRPPRIEKKPPHIMSEDEVFRLFESTMRTPAPRRLRDRALLELIYSTGMRVSEVIALKLSDVDFEAATARCEGKGARQRAAPLTQRAMAALKDYLDNARTEMLGQNAGEYIFLDPVGTRLTRQAIWLTTRQYARSANLEGDVTPHILRHSRAVHMLRAGEDIHRVQEWFGHANLATTQMYMQKENKPAVLMS